ncbi:hypothetical protein CBL_04709 [Carabus blaptoides fortunei]
MSARTTLRPVEENDAEQKEKKRDVNIERLEQIIWREWSDAELNSEKWDYMIKLPEKTKVKATAKSGSTTTLESGLGDVIDSTGHYCDPYSVPLPWSFTTGRAEISWVRPATLNPNTRIVVYTTNAGTIFPDLISRNRHIMHSQLVRVFICAIHTLMYLGCTRPFRVEWPTAQYTPNTMGDQQPWKPWHHVYAKCRAGKDQQHLPLVNPSGKYIVRLYWMGSWRKFTLDDRIPVDTKTGQVLLPLIAAGVKDELELWPVLVMKALLKIASLTWTSDNEIVDFDIITCLTGWIGQKIKTKDVELDDVWQILQNYTDKFAWEQKVRQSKSKQESKMTSRETSGKMESDSKKDGDKTSTKSEKSSKTSKGQKSTAVVKEPSRFHLVATCKDLRITGENLVSNLTPCWDHEFLIDQTRDIPLVERIVDPSKELAPWKQYRWVRWAIHQNIWERVEIEDDIKCLKVVSSMKQLPDHHEDVAEKTNLVSPTVKIIDEKDDTNKPSNKGKKDKSDKKSATDSSQERKSRSQHQFIDPSVWCDFHKLGDHITAITIYFKPSTFPTNIVLSNIQFNTTVDTRVKKVNRKEEKKNKIDSGVVTAPEPPIKHIHWMSESCNIAPIYLCTDSIDIKLILLSAATVASDFPMPEIKKRVDFEQIDKVVCTKYVCKLGKCAGECRCQNTIEEEMSVPVEKFVDTRKHMNISIEDYIWNSRETADAFIKIQSYGTKNVLVELSRGRHVKKLTLQNEKPFVLIFLSNTELTVGKIDEILDSMVSESHMLTETCYDICSTFGNLIKNFGTSVYPSLLRDFYKSYSISGYLSKTQLETVHGCFLEELIKIFAEVFPEEQYYNVSRAIRVLLLNPDFRIPLPGFNTFNNIYVEPIAKDNECKCEDIDGMKLREDSAIKIQAFFKMLYIRQLMLVHDPFHKDFSMIVDILKNIYTAMFSNKYRHTICMNLLRNLVNNEKLTDIAHYFPYHKELNSVIWLTKFTGEIKHADAFSWVPIVRQLFHFQSNDDILIRVYLLCDRMTDYMLRIFNNDTGEEMERNENEALVCRYRKNEKGYTILGYGQVQDEPVTNMQWKLYIVTNKSVNPLPIVAEPTSITSLQVKENYIANLDNLICRCNIKISHTSMISLRFSVSSDDVKIKLQCLDKNGDVLLETIDTTNVLMPVLILEANENSESMESSSLGAKTSTRSSADTSRLLVRKSTKYRMSSDKRSTQSRVSTKNKRKPTIVPVSNFLTEYTMQAFVLDDSWPLTAKEWTLVEQLKTRNFIEDELLANSSNQLSRSISAKLPRRKLTVSKKFNDKSADSIPIPKPFWNLTAVYDIGSNAQMDIDDSRNEEIKSVKRECFAGDPERLLEGKQLRKDFLERNYKKFFEYDDSQTTYNMSVEYSSSSLTNRVVGSSYILKPSTQERTVDYGQLEYSSVHNNIQLDANAHFQESPFRWIPTEHFEKELEAYRQYQFSEAGEQILNKLQIDMEKWKEDNTYYLRRVNEFMDDWRKQIVRLKEQNDDVQQKTINIWKEYDKVREEYLEKGDKAKNKGNEKATNIIKK